MKAPCLASQRLFAFAARWLADERGRKTLFCGSASSARRLLGIRLGVQSLCCLKGCLLGIPRAAALSGDVGPTERTRPPRGARLTLGLVRRGSRLRRLASLASSTILFRRGRRHLSGRAGCRCEKATRDKQAYDNCHATTPTNRS